MKKVKIKKNYKSKSYNSRVNKSGGHALDYLVLVLIVAISGGFYMYSNYGVPNILLGVVAGVTAGVGAFKEFFKTLSYFGFGGKK